MHPHCPHPKDGRRGYGRVAEAALPKDGDGQYHKALISVSVLYAGFERQ